MASNNLTFVEAILLINNNKNLDLCDDYSELNGERPICVYKEDVVIGKLRWPQKNGDFCKIDDEVLRELLNE